MKKKRALYGIIGYATVALAILVLPGCGGREPDDIAECEGPMQCSPGYPGGRPVAAVYASPPMESSPAAAMDIPTEVIERQAVEYGDGFFGKRACKSRQVKKLQCMLNHLGYCTEGVDGQYGDETVKAVRKYLTDYSHIIANRDGRTDGRSLSWPQWKELELENQAGSQCSKYGTFE
jgi:hypothetical protein